MMTADLSEFMSRDAQPIAWQPLTPRGVAVFAGATLGRLLLVQLVVAIGAAAVLVWTLDTGWFPVITSAIDRLPPGGVIRHGALQWPADSPQMLAENRFLALSVDLEHGGQARSPAHVQAEFGRSTVKILSLLGYVELAYPRGYIISFNRPELWPWWGAWAPALLGITVVGTIAALLITWAVLASVYCWIAWLLAFFANRELTLRQSWRLAGAALMPGALVMIAGLMLYALGVLDPVRLLAAAALHFVVGWAFLCVSPFYLPRHPAAPPPARLNPFQNKPAQPADKSK